MKLTDQALHICRDNYAKNCGGCPLRNQCVSTIGPGYEGLNKWTAKVNDAAKVLSSDSTASPSEAAAVQEVLF